MRHYIAVTVAMICFAGPASAQAPAIKHVEVPVASTNDEWTPTTLTVSPGDILLIDAPGSVTVGQYIGKVSANGTSDGLGALELKVGVGAAQRAGAHAYVVVDRGGPVKVRIHDTKYEDNSGDLAVSVVLIPAATIPVAKPVE